MGDEEIESNEGISRMFACNKEAFSSDEMLALHIIHKFNIDRDTMETMPAFEEHIEPLFSKVK